MQKDYTLKMLTLQYIMHKILNLIHTMESKEELDVMSSAPEVWKTFN